MLPQFVAGSFRGTPGVASIDLREPGNEYSAFLDGRVLVAGGLSNVASMTSARLGSSAPFSFASTASKVPNASADVMPTSALFSFAP